MEKKPNIVLITVDQMRRDCLGALGHPVVETPNLDSMKRNGFVFTKAYTAVPSCIPSRAALLTGLSQKKHGRVGYKDGIPWNYKNTIASEFSNAGYHTQSIGKMHVFPERSLCGFHNVILHDGYLHHSRDYKRIASETFANNDDYLFWLKKEKGIECDLTDSGLECNSWVARPFPYEEKYHPTNWCVSESIDFLRRRDTTKPFFMFTSFVRPHSPLDPPEFYFNMYDKQCFEYPLIGEWADKEDIKENGLNIDAKWGIISGKSMHRAKAAYYGSITHIDHQLGRLFQAFGEHNILKETIFIFVSDHGDMMGDHNFFRKALPYEGSSGVPLIIYDPGNILNASQNKVINSLIELRDIMPTLLNMANIEVPQDVDGKSFLKALYDENFELREYIHGEHELLEYSNEFIVTKKDKYIWFSQTGEEQYFDLLNDPKELFNAINLPENKERVDYLRKKLIFELKDREEGYTDGKVLIKGRKAKTVLNHILKHNSN